MSPELLRVLPAAACFLVFVVLGVFVAQRPPTRLDVEATALRGQAVPLAILFTRLGRWYSVVTITLVATAAAFLLHGNTALVARLFILQALSQGAVNLLKVAYGRPRPDQWLHRFEIGSSYPSGHAATAMTFFLGFLLFAVPFVHFPRGLGPLVSTALVACVVGLPWSRIALGAHYATDVIGGLLFGAGCLCTYAAVALRLAAPPPV